MTINILCRRAKYSLLSHIAYWKLQLFARNLPIKGNNYRGGSYRNDGFSWRWWCVMIDSFIHKPVPRPTWWIAVGRLVYTVAQYARWYLGREKFARRQEKVYPVRGMQPSDSFAAPAKSCRYATVLFMLWMEVLYQLKEGMCGNILK